MSQNGGTELKQKIIYFAMWRSSTAGNPPDLYRNFSACLGRAIAQISVSLPDVLRV